MARDTKAAAKAMIDMVRGGEETNDGGIRTSNNGKDDDNNECKPAAKPTGVDDGGKEGVDLNNVVIEERVTEAVADGGRDNNNFEGDGNDCKPAAKPTGVDNGGKEGADLSNVVIKERDAEAVTDGGRDDNNFDKDGSNLGQGEEETTLTDGAKDPVSDAGAKNSSVDNTDEIGIIFNFEGKIKRVCLKEFGSYVKFNYKCLHRGYKRGSVKTYLSA